MKPEDIKAGDTLYVETDYRDEAVERLVVQNDTVEKVLLVQKWNKDKGILTYETLKKSHWFIKPKAEPFITRLKNALFPKKKK